MFLRIDLFLEKKGRLLNSHFLKLGMNEHTYLRQFLIENKEGLTCVLRAILNTIGYREVEVRVGMLHEHQFEPNLFQEDTYDTSNKNVLKESEDAAKGREGLV